MIRFDSEVLYRDQLPSPREFGRSPVLIYDRVLAAKVPGFRAWARQFPIRFEVEAGEKLKQLSSFSRFIQVFMEKTAELPASSLCVVSVGGGSVGDFSGFLASVFKRGVELVHLPSTWLSALDSSHGGKTALNIGGVKNQIGTFYPASRIYLVRKLLFGQPEARTAEAFGELAKIAMIDGGPWVSSMIRSKLRSQELIWKFLPRAVEAKYRVVRRDPFEKKKIRQVLNLGHTLGHVLEAHHGLAHGAAVAQGLVFAVRWSVHRGVMNEEKGELILGWLAGQFGIRREAGSFKPIPEDAFLRLLQQDKKRDTRSSVLFVFLKRIGKTVLTPVTLQQFLAEARRQGWVAS